MFVYLYVCVSCRSVVKAPDPRSSCPSVPELTRMRGERAVIKQNRHSYFVVVVPGMEDPENLLAGAQYRVVRDICSSWL